MSLYRTFAARPGRGHYEQPRRTTSEGLATALGCTKTTVGEHLRKAEEKVLTGIARD